MMAMPSEHPPIETHAECTGKKNGTRMLRETHDDIDVSDIVVSCTAGSVEVTLQERIWWSWTRRNIWTLSAGQAMNATVEVDSWLFDGDHRLTIFARADATQCTVDWDSYDL
jgi:hypothetical protein